MTECPFTELPPEQCACPKHRGGMAPDEFVIVGQMWDAIFPGLCSRGDHIDVRDRIGRTDDGEYVHERCVR